MSFNRRRFMQMMGVALLTPYSVISQSSSGPYADFIELSTGFGLRNRDSKSVFDLSVASGDPTSSGVILWTHIKDSVYDGISPLYFEVSHDRSFSRIVLQGVVKAEDFSSERDHTINLDLNGKLRKYTTYYYRFIYRNTVSRVGRCKTLPGSHDSLNKLRFAVVTCQDYTTGYYNAYSHLAKESLDFVLHLGDFIYEYDRYEGFESAVVRPIQLPSGEKVAMDLRDYRHLYRTYRSDPNLQRAMENHTFIITWDDHETADDVYWDYSRDTLGAPHHPYQKEYDNNTDLLRQLRRDAQRAWIEYIPARVEVDESASHALDYLKLYRKFKVGRLLDLFITDSRTYRSQQPCGDGNAWENYWCYDYEKTSQTMLGREQRNWLINGLTGSNATWKVWGNQTLLAQLAMTVLGHQVAYANYDAWDVALTQFEKVVWLTVKVLSSMVIVPVRVVVPGFVETVY